MECKKSKFKKLLLSKIDRKLTLLFIIVAIIAPVLGISYFYTIAILPKSITPAEAEALRTIALMMILLIAINAGVIGYLVSKSITRPIKQLYNATKEMEQGNYDVRININTKDEFQELGEAFNKAILHLGKMREEREEIDRAKSEFLSITSHELRSPITPMKAQLQMLEQGYFGKLKKEQIESLAIVIRNADRLDRIISDFLEISRIETARLKFDFRKINLAETIQDTVKFMQGFAKEKQIQLNVKIGRLPTIEADPDRISQVIRNLINNAIKFSEPKSKIEINAEKQDNQILLSVRDHGCGLSPADQIRVFEPFYQVEGHLRRKHGGFGLGLAICRGIVECQKGKIWVESKPGEGCKFNFTVPLEPVRKIEPIKVLFSPKQLIDKKIKEEFKTMLGPLGIGEFNELKNKNALNMQDLIEYVDTLMNKYILDEEHGLFFKNRIRKIFGEEKDTCLENSVRKGGVTRN